MTEGLQNLNENGFQIFKKIYDLIAQYGLSDLRLVLSASDLEMCIYRGTSFGQVIFVVNVFVDYLGYKR